MPFSEISLAGMISRSPWLSRQTIAPPRTNAPLSTSFERLNQNTEALMAEAIFNARLVVRVQNGEIARALVLENTGLGGGVILERIVPVKVIGSDIQHHRNLGMKVSMVSSWKLLISSTTQVSSVEALDEAYRRGSYVSADQRLTASGRDDFARQRRGRGLAVGAGDGNDLAFEEARRQFYLADDWDAQGARLHQLRNIERHARTDHDQVLIAEGAFAMLSGFHGYAVVEQQRNFVTKLLLRLGVGDGDPGATLLQEQSAGHAGLAKPDHQHAFAFNVHRAIGKGRAGLRPASNCALKGPASAVP